jgi:hypothetical protein
VSPGASTSSGTKLRHKRIWTVSDFAAHTGLSHWQAKQVLLRLDAELNGMLLTRGKGTNRRYTFARAALAKAKPDLFAEYSSLEERIEELETELSTLKAEQRRHIQQTGQNTRDIAKMRAERSSSHRQASA